MLRYRFLLSLLACAVVLQAIWRRDWTGLTQRLGRGAPPERRPRVWLHAASNGELTSARPVLDALVRDGHAVLITCNSTTGVALARSWDLPGCAARLAPLDLRRATGAVLRNWDIRALILMEAELWPNRVLMCPGPVCVMGARLTESTARIWAKLGAAPRKTLTRLRFVSAQDTGSAERLVALGLPPATLGPTVTLKERVTPVTEALPPEIARAFPRETTWLAASTHEGEEQIIAEAHKSALAREPDLQMILAPRHPKRGPEVLRLLQSAGLDVAVRSRDEAPRRGAVYLADTLGDMPLWYRCAGRVFVGGSLVDKGGHTPFEPAAYGCAVLHGPHLGNFLPSYGALTAAGASFQVSDAVSLAEALTSLQDSADQRRLGAEAQTLLSQTDGVDTVLTRLREIVDRSVDKP